MMVKMYMKAVKISCMYGAKIQWKTDGFDKWLAIYQGFSNQPFPLCFCYYMKLPINASKFCVSS